MKFIGHLDLMRYFQKVMRRADVNIRYSGGFSPHQIMSFASPLGVGMESRGEYVDIEVLSTDSSKEMLSRINDVIGDEMEALSYRLLPDDAANAMSIVAAADYTVSFREGYEPDNWEQFAAGLMDFLNQEEIMILKKTKKGEKEINLRPLIYELSIEEGQKIHMKIATGSAANIKPDLVIRTCLERLGQTMADFALQVTRMEVYGNRGTDEQPDFCPLEDFGENIE